MAFLAHLLQVFTWWIAPLVIFAVKRQSRFVAFHALQVLFWQLIYTALFFGAFILLFVSIILTPQGGAQSSQQGPPPFFVVFFPLIMLIGMGGWAVNIVLAIVYGMKSLRGEWAEYPVVGRWARRVVGI